MIGMFEVSDICKVILHCMVWCFTGTLFLYSQYVLRTDGVKMLPFMCQEAERGWADLGTNTLALGVSLSGSNFKLFL